MTPETQNKPATEQALLPAEWPGAFGIYKYSKQAVTKNLGPIILATLLLVFSSFVIERIFSDAFIINQLLGWLAGAYFSVVLILLYLAGAKGRRRELGEVFGKAGSYFVNMAILTLLETLIAIVSLLLLIVPFFIVMPRLVLAQYFLIDQDMDAIEALKASWAATGGNVGKVWGIFGAIIAMALLIVLIVGIYFLIMYSAAFAILYLYLTLHKTTPAQENSDKSG